MGVDGSSGKTVTIPLGFYQLIFSRREIYPEVTGFDRAIGRMGA
jgi:hypothetical protein